MSAMYLLMVGSSLICMNLANKKNRSIQGWGSLGFILPVISIIILNSLIKLRVDHDANKNVNLLDD